jgi:hypothetical protein
VSDATAMSPLPALSPFADLLRRLRSHPAWVAAQFWVTLLIVLAGIAWTRLPDRHIWQVMLSLLIPLLLLIAVLELQAGAMRAFADDDGRRLKLVWGAATLLVWLAVGWACWAALDWCDDQIPKWAGYLNSHASAHWRATLFTYRHIQSWFALAEGILRWIIVPAKIIPYAIVTAQWGWRIPVRRVIRMLFNWRWWLAMVLAAYIGVALPSRFFSSNPHGTVSAQVWAVVLKLAATYLLAIGCWVLLLAWAAVLFARQPQHGSAHPADDSLIPAPSAPERSAKVPFAYRRPIVATTPAGSPERSHSSTCARP